MKIYVELLGEGTAVWRPVEADHIQDNLYRITEANAQLNDERWSFEAGSVVKCRSKRSQERDPILVAYERVEGSHQS